MPEPSVNKSEPSVIKKAETVWDDLRRLWRRRPWLAALVIAFFLAPTGVFVYEHFWGKADLKERLAQVRNELADAKRDRDAKATQLAPFLAVAQKTFADAPPEKRLELLSRRVESLEKNLSDAQPRGISSNALWTARSQMLQLGVPISFVVRPEFADLESAILVRQISEVLLVAGSGFTAPPGELPMVPIKGIRVEYAPGLSAAVPILSNVFVGICQDLNRQLTVLPHSGLGETNRTDVTVGIR